MANGLTRYNRPRTVGRVVSGSADAMERRMASAPAAAPTMAGPSRAPMGATGPISSDPREEYYRSRIEAATAGQDPSNPPVFSLPGAEEELFGVFGDIFSPTVYPSGGGSSSQITPYQQAQLDLSREQLNLSREQQAAEQARIARGEQLARTGATAQNQFLSGLIANLGSQYQPLLDELERSRGAGQERIQGTYQTALEALQSRGRQAGELTTEGYNALARFLAENQPQAFASAQRAAAPTLTPGAVEQYARAIGAPTGQIGQAAVQAATEQAAGGEAYNRLLGLLQAQERAGAGSRAAEVEMARAANAAQLQALLTGGQTQLEQQRAAATNALLNQIEQGRFNVLGQRTQQEQALQQLLAQILGTGNVTLPTA